jgi:hypothetical protein
MDRLPGDLVSVDTYLRTDLAVPPLDERWERPVEVAARNAKIQYHWATESPEYAAPNESMLLAFANLSLAGRATDDLFAQRVAEYAGSWGALGTDAAGQLQPTPFEESLDEWHAFAAQARAMLRIGHALRQGSTIEASDRATLKNADPRVSWPTGDNESWADGRNLGRHVTRWLAIGHARPEFGWDDQTNRPIFGLRSVSLIGALGLAIAADLNGSSRQIAMCSECSHLYRPRRRPDARRDNFCDKCGQRAAWRRSKRRRRETERANANT